MTLSILVVGTGAVGGFYGSRLQHPPSSSVSLVCRSNYRAVKEANGLTLQTHSFGSYHFSPASIYPSIEDASTARGGKEWDYLLVTSKALPDVEDGSEAIEPLVGEKTAIVLIQNGIGIEEPYRKRFPRNPIISAVTVVSASQPSHGRIVQNRWTRISLGPYGGDRNTVSSIRTLEALLKTGGIKDAEVYESEADFQLLRWHKLAINSSMNPSSVLSNGTPNARMSKDPELREHLKGVMEEIFYAAEKVTGKKMDFEKYANAERILRSSERNEGGMPSMWGDWERGAAMELEVILGNPIRLAREKGVQMPRLQTLYALIKMAQRRRDEKVEESKGKKARL
ncbi:2-dehydropantoate 2-reductase [Atractiella rhizophila]|nr:2-dehydropantoate 2-reductase [Atractiella rhizophila]